MQAAPTMPVSTSISMKAETRLAEQSIMGSDDLSRFMSFPHTDPLPGSLPATHYSQTKVWYATCSIIHPDYDMLPAVQYKFRLRYDE